MCKVQCPHLLPEAEQCLLQSKQEYRLFLMVLFHHHHLVMIPILVFLVRTGINDVGVVVGNGIVLSFELEAVGPCEGPSSSSS